MFRLLRLPEGDCATACELIIQLVGPVIIHDVEHSQPRFVGLLLGLLLSWAARLLGSPRHEHVSISFTQVTVVARSGVVVRKAFINLVEILIVEFLLMLVIIIGCLLHVHSRILANVELLLVLAMCHEAFAMTTLALALELVGLLRVGLGFVDVTLALRHH